jgi:hypothetical protein
MTAKRRRTKKNRSDISVVIYGIFHEKDGKLLMVSLSKDDTETELELGDYDDCCCIVEMPIDLIPY